MVGAIFNTINQKDGGMWLSQMTVSGYKDVSVFQSEGVLAEFQIKVLDMNGGNAKDKDGNPRVYDFYDVREDGEWLGAVWYQGEETEIVDDMVVFDPGEGLWFYVAPSAYPEGENPKYTLLNNGEALMDASTVDLREGSKGIVAPLSAPVWLSKIGISGYKDVSVFQSEGVLAEFQIKVLDMNGGNAKDKDGNLRVYDYYDVREDGEWLGGVWYQGEETEISGDMVTFEPGEGLWVYVAPAAFPAGETPKYKMEFPGLDDMTK